MPWQQWLAGVHERRPPSLLVRRAVNWPSVAGGAVAVGAVLSTLTTMAIVATIAARAQGPMVAARPPPRAAVEVALVERPFVKLGRHFKARELPNRQREARTTAPRRSRAPTKSARRVRIEDAGVAPLVSIEEALVNLGNRAEEQARIARAAEQEGDPDGIAEGTATREEGDIYRGQLYTFFRRGLNRPEAVPDDVLRGLRATVRVSTGPAGQITGYQLRSSGNDEFDQAVRLRMDQAVGARIPEPPEEDRARYFGATFPIGIRPPR